MSPVAAEPRRGFDELRGAVVPEDIVLTPQQQRARRNRNIAIGVAVGFFALLFYVVTIAKLGPGILKSPT